MARQSSLLQFSLPQKYHDKLADLQRGDESSLSVVAKRLIVDLLDGSPDTSMLQSQLADHETRLQALENPDHPIGRFLNKSSKEE
jgi:hypothetical protein